MVFNEKRRQLKLTKIWRLVHSSLCKSKIHLTCQRWSGWSLVLRQSIDICIRGIIGDNVFAVMLVGILIWNLDVVDI